MNSKIVAIFAGFAVAGLSLPSSGHHGSNVVYDLNESITISGTVTEFQFVNPHTLILFEITGEDGSVVTWLAGMSSSLGLARNEGWTRETINTGDEVIITGAPARNDAPSIWVEQIEVNGEPMLKGRYTG
jgi:DNA/RNA endonuclease YhcR with UshA esterase domain